MFKENKAIAAVLVLMVGFLCGRGFGEEYVWIEGESSGKHDFTRHGWYDNVNKDVMSGRNWLSHYNKKRPGTATYIFTIREEGTYTWWLRCNVLLAELSYKLDDQKFQRIDLLSDPRGRIRVSRKPDHRDIAWVKAATFRLSPGQHRLILETRSKIANHGGIDCMCLVDFPWAPAGIKRPAPGPQQQAGPETWFPVLPDDDPFSPDSITDMSRFVDQPAGKDGFVKRRGNEIVLAKTGRPIKFWGIVANMSRTPQRQETQARLYAKHGINMIRQHPLQSVLGVLKKDPHTGQRVFNQDALDRWDRWFATLKKHGIYMTWSCFYPHIITKDDDYPEALFAELPRKGRGKKTSGFVNFMRLLQDAEWIWLETLLRHKNPYTNLRYIDDPALAIVEVHNEDCIFWHWPLNKLAEGKEFPKHTAQLKRQWMNWLKDRYHTDAALHAAWGRGHRWRDSVENPDMGIYGAWEMGAKGPKRNPAEKARMGDFIRFLAETQRGYFQRREKRLRSLGFKGMTLSTAWRAGGPAADPANIWCDDAMDVISRHNYFGGGAGGHNIRIGKVANDTHLARPGSGILASGLYQVEDKPFVMTEWTQKPPNQWKAEITPLVAFYGLGLQGWDASYQFAGSMSRMGSGWPKMHSYVTETPHYLGQFPAVSFAVYNGHFKESAPLAARRLDLNDIFMGTDALLQDFTGGDHDTKQLKGDLKVPPEIIAVGRVTIKISRDAPISSMVDLDRYWDKTSKTVKSSTGQMTWDYENRVVMFHSEKTQGLVGFAGGRDYSLPAVQVKALTRFVVLLFTPLDNAPLASSRHILITAMARDKQTGAKYNHDGTELLAAGMPPLLMEPVQASIELEGAPIASIRTVDIFGVPTETQVPHKDNAFDIDGRYETYYYEVKR